MSGTLIINAVRVKKLLSAKDTTWLASEDLVPDDQFLIFVETILASQSAEGLFTFTALSSQARDKLK